MRAPGLVRYYQTQDFDLRYTVQRTHARVYLLERQAARIDGLRDAFAAGPPASDIS